MVVKLAMNLILLLLSEFEMWWWDDTAGLIGQSFCVDAILHVFIDYIFLIVATSRALRAWA